MVAQLLALRTERDELKAALMDACGLLASLSMAHPHEPTGDCLHCAYLDRAVELGRPLERYRAEMAQTMADFARDNPERYGEIRRAVLRGADGG
jgi:hypothetical protein